MKLFLLWKLFPAWLYDFIYFVVAALSYLGVLASLLFGGYYLWFSFDISRFLCNAVFALILIQVNVSYPYRK